MIVGHGARRGLLIAQVLQEIARGAFGERVFRHELIRRLVRGKGAHAAGKRADGTTEFQRTADVLTVPEGHPARNPWRGRDKHAVLRDRLDPPARRAEEEDVALLRFEDHLLVELADAALALLRAREEDTVEPAVRNRAAIRDRHDLRALPRADDARGPIPDDARPQLRELVRWIAAREHVEHTLERAAR